MPCIRPNHLLYDGEECRFLKPKEAQYASALNEPGLVPIPCGQCISCRVQRSIGWKIRGLHEQQSTFHPTYAVTLTYDEAHLPESGSLRRSDLQSFHRRLRYQTGFDFRFLACGEYGPTTGRAHYHGIYFGLRLPDVYKSGHRLVSRTLLNAWGNGQITFHLANQASIGYVSGYVVKKLRSERKLEPLMTTVAPNGLILDETPVRREFLQASNRPGLGTAWIEQFGDQVLANGFIIIKEKPCYVIPSFYLKKLRNRPGFPDFAAKRVAKLKENPPLLPEELSLLGIQLEADVARRSRSAV